MTREGRIQYYNERIAGCERIIQKGGKNIVRFKNNKKFWTRQLKKFIIDEI